LSGDTREFLIVGFFLGESWIAISRLFRRGFRTATFRLSQSCYSFCTWTEADWIGPYSCMWSNDEYSSMLSLESGRQPSPALCYMLLDMVLPVCFTRGISTGGGIPTNLLHAMSWCFCRSIMFSRKSSWKLLSHELAPSDNSSVCVSNMYLMEWASA
jgi:hypothetical protein